MTLKLHDPINGDGLFDVQGKAFGALAALASASKTTIPTAIEDFISQFMACEDSHDLRVAEIIDGLGAAVQRWQGDGTSLARSIRNALANHLQQLVAKDADEPEGTLAYALEYLISQMKAQGYYVAGNTISLTLTPAAGNAGDATICYTNLGGDGLVQQGCLPEAIKLSIAGTTGPVVRFRAPEAQANQLAPDWPRGSGTNLALLATTPAASLIGNGDFERTTIPHVPDEWMVQIGTPGSTVRVTDLEVQTVAISGTPTGGSYLLQWVGPDGITRSTTALAHDASGAVVQSALRLIPGLEAVTVATAGTAPDYTHAITFHGAGDPAQLTSVNDLAGGTSPAITHATTVAASPGSYRGRALEFRSNGSELTAVYHALRPLADTVYFCHTRLRRQGATEAGAVRLAVVDGIGGSVVQDAAGNPAELAIDAADIADSCHESKWFSFCVPSAAALPVYLRIRIASPVDAGCSIFFDDVMVAEGARLYAGGPYVAAFGGRVASQPDDSWTLTVANDRAGAIQEWYQRVFDMAGKGLLLPIAGTTLIPQNWT